MDLSSCDFFSNHIALPAIDGFELLTTANFTVDSASFMPLRIPQADRTEFSSGPTSRWHLLCTGVLDLLGHQSAQMHTKIGFH
jgi:hypothetical protein